MDKRIQEIFRKMANDKGISVEQLRADMIVAIHSAAIAPGTQEAWYKKEL